ncbi:MAG: Asp-tRNA(Asn)/Glu-tRNA(Gln) amidotransferase subunit GatA [Myxococcales bacterium]|nr:Asp-tRNA(Asn)/Glu-tRNA(Gln) amidotransferase subunit GatA [Myxococcales bacterium]
MNIADLSLAEASDQLASGTISSEALTSACLSRIEALPALNTFIHVAATTAMKEARASDTRRANKASLGPLDGIPIGLKDLFVTKDMPTTAGSKILADWQAPYDGTVVKRLREAGAVIVGKNNQDEFAMGSSNEHSAAGPCVNPWHKDRVPGGSSGGSAAAVAAGQVLGSLGTDTGGSIRQPASFCGIYGLRPTYGRVSRSGVVAFASSLDQVGPFGRSAKDIALLMNVIGGFDPLDSTSAQRDHPDPLLTLKNGVKGLRIGLPHEYFSAAIDPEVDQVVRKAVQALQEAGATVQSVSLPHTKHALSTYYILCMAEASSNLARYDGVRYGYRAEETELRKMYARSRFEGFGPEVIRRILLGTYVLCAGYREAYYERAQRVRTLIRRDFESAYEGIDILLSPVSPTVAFERGSKTNDPLAMYTADILTLSVNLAGIPGLSVPVGFSSEGLPIGLQLMGKWFDEARLLQTAQALEDVLQVHQQRPKLVA